MSPAEASRFERFVKGWGRQFRALVAVLTTASVVKLFCGHLQPDNLPAIYTFGVMSSGLSLVLAYFTTRLRVAFRRRLQIVLGAAVALVALVVAHTVLVEEVSYPDTVLGAQRYVVSPFLSEKGASDMGLLDASTVGDLIKKGGWNNVPAWFEWLGFFKVLYGVAYILAFSGLVLSVGLTSDDAK